MFQIRGQRETRVRRARPRRPTLVGLFGKIFWPLLAILALEWVFYLFGVGYFTQRRVDHALRRARRHTTSDDLQRDLSYLSDILRDYESHVAAAGALIADPDMRGIESIREQVAYAREVVGVALDERQRADQRALDFFANYEPPPVGVLRPASRTRMKALMWVTVGVAAVALVCLFRRPEML